MKSFLGMILIPNLFLAILILCLSMYFIYQNTIQVVEGSNLSVLSSVENTISSVSSLSNYPVLNQETIRMLRKDYADYGSKAVLEQINDAKKMETDLSVQIFHMNDAIHSVFLLPENTQEIYATFSGGLLGDRGVEYTDWYQPFLENRGKVTVIGQHTLALSSQNIECFTVGRCLIDSMRDDALLGVLFINIPVERITALWKDGQFSQDSFTVLIDESQHVIHRAGVPLPEQELEEIAGRAVQKQESHFLYFSPTLGSYFLAINSRADDYGWHISSLIPVEELFASGYIMVLFFTLVIMGLLAFLILLAGRTARRITHPVDELKETIRQIEQGNLQVRARESDDEIGLLAKSFNHMTRRLRSLIRRIQREEKAKRNAELLALQSQINPHFLYNTLNSIKVMAQIQGASSVARTLDTLIGFLRFCSKNTQEIISLGEELQITEKYLEIMNIRYMDSIHCRISVPDDLLDNATIRFLLQPVIENALLHGFDPDSEDRRILIRATRQKDRILIQVADNGQGMSEETLQQLLHQRFRQKRRLSTNIGLDNINQRIKFSFGRDFGISIRSREKFYTVVDISLPRITKDAWEQYDTENSHRRGRTPDTDRDPQSDPLAGA